MTVLESVPEQLGLLVAKLEAAGPWSEEGGSWWLSPGQQKVRALATAMNEAGARFITITAFELPEGEGVSLDYLWDWNGKVLGFRIFCASKSIASIADVCEAADWIEREIHDGWAVEFTGREVEPLLLRRDDTAGVNLRKEGE